MSLRNRNGMWHWRFEVDGHEYSGATDLAATERNRIAAVRIEQQAYQMVRSGQAHQLKTVVKPFIEAAQEYLRWADGEYRNKVNTVRRIRTSFSSLLAHFGKIPVGAITPGKIEEYKTWRRVDHKVKEVTLRHDLHALSLFFQYAMKHNWRPNNPVTADLVPSDADAVRMHVLDDEEEAAYIAAARQIHQDLHDLARLMLEQGCRPMELLSLPKPQVDLMRGYLQIGEGKSKAARRRLRLTPESKLILAPRLSTEGPWIFPAERPKRHRPATSVANWHEAARKLSGVRCVLYDLRHTFGTRAAAAGMALPTLKTLMGHSSITTTMRYIHPSQSDIDAAMEWLAERKNPVRFRSGETRETGGTNGKTRELNGEASE